MIQRRSNNPKRRIAPLGSFTEADKESLLRMSRYVGSALHKRNPANYGFYPPVNPRGHKSLCDDVRSIPLQEAQRLFESGIRKGIVSTYKQDGIPKYVWSVDEQGEVYEAKLGNDGYHGYRLNKENESIMRNNVLQEWKTRS